MLNPAPARRYLALWFPLLSAERMRQRRDTQAAAAPAEAICVTVEKQRGVPRLAGLDREAVRLGLQLGMTLADARARLPALVVDEADPQADAALLRRLAGASEYVTPLVGLDGADGLILDITGCAHLFRGEASLCDVLRRRLAPFGLTIRTVVASTPEAARAFARFTSGGIIAPGSAAADARSLPVTALDQPGETTLALTRAGLKTLGDLADRPRETLVARFGAGLTARLDRILGLEDIRITPLRREPDLIAEKRFPEPLWALDAVLRGFESLAHELVGMLERRQAGARQVEAVLFRADGLVRRMMIETGAPSRDAALLIRLLQLRIDGLADPLDPGFGFDLIRLSVVRSEDLPAEQADLAGGADEADEADDRAITDLVGRLMARLGKNQVRRFIAEDSHDPTLNCAILPYLAQAPDADWPPLMPGDPPARPLTLFPNPQPVEVIAAVPDGPPLRFRWRKVLHQVARAEGPERIAPAWWRGDEPRRDTRDYYRIEDEDGRRFWIFREGLYEVSPTPPRWFLHGLFA